MRTTEIAVQRDVQIAAGTTKIFYFWLPPPGTIRPSTSACGTAATRSTRSRQRRDSRAANWSVSSPAGSAGRRPAARRLARSGHGRCHRVHAARDRDRRPRADGTASVRHDRRRWRRPVRQLDDTQQATLLSWVSWLRAGSCYYDDDSAVADLPGGMAAGGPTATHWPTSARSTSSTARRLRSGHWDQIIPITAGDGDPRRDPSSSTEIPQMDLAQRAGLDLPTIAPLAVGIGVYAVVLDRSSTWCCAGCAAFTLQLVTSSQRWRCSRPAASRWPEVARCAMAMRPPPRSIQESPAGAYGISNVLTFSSQGGTTNMAGRSGRLDTRAARKHVLGRWPPRTPRCSDCRSAAPDGTSVSAAVALEATQANVRAYAGNMPNSGLVVTAEWDGDRREVTGTVSNNSDVVYRDVAVFAGGDDEALVGDLAPGASADFSMNAVRKIRFAFETRGAAWCWGDPFQAATAVLINDTGRPLPNVDENNDSGGQLSICSGPGVRRPGAVPVRHGSGRGVDRGDPCRSSSTARTPRRRPR